jgi:hypothetical protein
MLIHPLESLPQMSTQTIVREDDIIPHVEDSRLYWVFRHGRQMQLTWNELTATEQQYQSESAERQAYHALFAPCGGEQW